MMKHSYRLALLLLLLFLAPACEKKPKEPSRPNVFRLNPSSATSENGFQHSIEMKVFCDIKFKLSLSDESWIRIGEQTAGENYATSVSLAMDTNNGSESRSSTLTITAGTMEKTFKITQLPLSASLTQTEIRLEYTKPTSITINLPSDWKINMEAADWLSIDVTEGSANLPTMVTFKANELNFSESEKVCNGNINIGNEKIALKVIHESSTPKGSFAEPVYGIYNYDGAGANLSYSELTQQTNLLKYPSELIFRLINPGESKFIEFAELPLEFTTGQEVNMCMYQNWMSEFGYKTTFVTSVLKVEEHAVWLIDQNNVGFVIKK